MIKLVENKIQDVIELCEKYSVQQMFLFGSSVSGSFTDSSDIDILISFKPDLSFEAYTDNYFGLHEDLEVLFSRKVDLITENSLSNPYFIQSIENNKKLLYAA